MNIKENPLEIYGETSSIQTSFSNVEDQKKTKQTKKRKKNSSLIKKVKNSNNNRRVTLISKGLNVIEEEQRSGINIYHN